jgi:hypothetical protein
MTKHTFNVETTVNGEVRKATGECELYADLNEVKEKITEDHLKLLNSIIVIRSQDTLRRSLQDKQTGLKATATALNAKLVEFGYTSDEIKLMSPEKKLEILLSGIHKQ